MDKELKKKWLQYNLEADLEYEEIYGNIFYLLFLNLIQYDLIYAIYGMSTKWEFLKWLFALNYIIVLQKKYFLF